MLINNNYVPMNNGLTILQSVEVSNTVNLISSCKNGYCGECRAQLVQGSVSYKSLPIAMVGDNEIIPCLAFANDDNVIVSQN
jgi:ferredoxin